MPGEVHTIYLKNDTPVTLTGLKNVQTNTLLDNTATVQMTLRKKADGSEVPGMAWPLVMTYIEPGKFTAILDSALELVKKGKYRLFIDIDQGALEGQFICEYQALERPCP